MPDEFSRPLKGRSQTPTIKAGESITLDVKFDHLNDRKVNVTSLVDFTLHNNCRPQNMANKPWSDFKYFISVTIFFSGNSVVNGVFLNP